MSEKMQVSCFTTTRGERLGSGLSTHSEAAVTQENGEAEPFDPGAGSHLLQLLRGHSSVPSMSLQYCQSIVVESRQKGEIVVRVK